LSLSTGLELNFNLFFCKLWRIRKLKFTGSFHILGIQSGGGARLFAGIHCRPAAQDLAEPARRQVFSQVQILHLPVLKLWVSL